MMHVDAAERGAAPACASNPLADRVAPAAPATASDFMKSRRECPWASQSGRGVFPVAQTAGIVIAIAILSLCHVNPSVRGLIRQS